MREVIADILWADAPAILAFVVLMLLSGCATPYSEIVAREVGMHERLQPWRYHAVNRDGIIICLAGDRPCHELLERSYTQRGHWVHE
jgi:hypothetical protein